MKTAVTSIDIHYFYYHLPFHVCFANTANCVEDGQATQTTDLIFFTHRCVKKISRSGRFLRVTTLKIFEAVRYRSMTRRYYVKSPVQKSTTISTYGGPI
jgi:hypothetical protein